MWGRRWGEGKGEMDAMVSVGAGRCVNHGKDDSGWRACKLGHNEDEGRPCMCMLGDSEVTMAGMQAVHIKNKIHK